MSFLPRTGIGPELHNGQLTKVQQVSHLKSQRDTLYLLSISSLVGQGISLFILLLLLLAYTRLANRPVPTLVQLVDGKAINSGALGHKQRTSAVIQRFVTNALTMLMSWQQQLPGTKTDGEGVPQMLLDPGLEVNTPDGKGRITTMAWQASFTFAEDFREPLVKLLARMTPPGVFRGDVQTALVLQEVTLPKQISEGQWRLEVVGNLVISRLGAGNTEMIPFNKEIFVRAVDTPPPPENGVLASPLEKTIYAVRQAGLEIYSMKDIK